jgi:hypothetical protein
MILLISRTYIKKEYYYYYYYYYYTNNVLLLWNFFVKTLLNISNKVGF